MKISADSFIRKAPGQISNLMPAKTAEPLIESELVLLQKLGPGVIDMPTCDVSSFDLSKGIEIRNLPNGMTVVSGHMTRELTERSVQSVFQVDIERESKPTPRHKRISKKSAPGYVDDYDNDQSNLSSNLIVDQSQYRPNVSNNVKNNLNNLSSGTANDKNQATASELPPSKEVPLIKQTLISPLVQTLRPPFVLERKPNSALANETMVDKKAKPTQGASPPIHNVKMEHRNLAHSNKNTQNQPDQKNASFSIDKFLTRGSKI